MCSSNKGNHRKKGEREKGLTVPKGAMNKFYLRMFLNHHLAQDHSMTPSLTFGLQNLKQWRLYDYVCCLSNLALVH